MSRQPLIAKPLSQGPTPGRDAGRPVLSGLLIVLAAVMLFFVMVKAALGQDGAQDTGAQEAVPSPVPVMIDTVSADTLPPLDIPPAVQPVAADAGGAGGGDGQPLVVPVFPRGSKLPEGAAALKDSYIVMDDGSVVSMADWVLGALNKNIGADMGDYNTRLFLGQVARAMAGLDEGMVDRRPVPRPTAVTPKALPPRFFLIDFLDAYFTHASQIKAPDGTQLASASVSVADGMTPGFARRPLTESLEVHVQDARFQSLFYDQAELPKPWEQDK